MTFSNERNFLFDAAFCHQFVPRLSEDQQAKAVSLFTGVAVEVPQDIQRRIFARPRNGAVTPRMETFKPSNLLLNWKKVIGDTPENTLLISGAMVNNWLMLLAAMAIVRKLFFLTRIKLKVEHAVILDTMWRKFGPDQGVAEERVFQAANEVLEASTEIRIDLRVEFHSLVDELVALKCIEVRDGRIWLVETFQYVDS